MMTIINGSEVTYAAADTAISPLPHTQKKKLSSDAIFPETFRFIIWIFRRVVVLRKNGSLEVLKVSYFSVDFSRDYLSGRILIDGNIRASACKD